VFFTAALTGLYAWHRLSLIDEEGTVSENAVREEVFAAVRDSFPTTAGLSMGMRRMTTFPYEMLRRNGSTSSKAASKSKKTPSPPPT